MATMVLLDKGLGVRVGRKELKEKMPVSDIMIKVGGVI